MGVTSYYILGLSDPAIITMQMASWAMNGLVAIGLFLLNRSAKRRDEHVAAIEAGRAAREADQRQKVEALEKRVREGDADLHSATEKLIDVRIREVTHRLTESVNAMSITLSALNSKIKDVDGQFDHMVAQDHKVELKLADRMEQVKDYIRDYAASKSDVKEHEKSMHASMTKLYDEIIKLGREVAAVGRKVS